MDEFNAWHNNKEFEINFDTRLYLSLNQSRNFLVYENTEFHTSMLNGALFKNSIPVSKGEILYHGDYIFIT